MLEKVVDGVADCAKAFADGRNEVKLEQVKMQHDAVGTTLVLGGTALVGYLRPLLEGKRK